MISKSFERIHRSNLVGMGIIPLCFKTGEDAETLGLTGEELYTIELPNNVSEIKPGQDVTVVTNNGKSFTCTLRFDTEVKQDDLFSSFKSRVVMSIIKDEFGMAGGVGLFQSRRDIAIRDQEPDQTIRKRVSPRDSFSVPKRFVAIKMLSWRWMRVAFNLNFAFFSFLFCFFLVNWNNLVDAHLFPLITGRPAENQSNV